MRPDLRVGVRVMLSDKGKRSLVERNPDRIGTIVRASRTPNMWGVLWDGLKTPIAYHENFLSAAELPRLTPPDWLAQMRARCAAAPRPTWDKDATPGSLVCPTCGPLKPEVDWLTHHNWDHPDEDAAPNTLALLALTEALAEALEARGHHDDCALFQRNVVDGCYVTRPCDCGLATALARYAHGPGATTGGGT